MNGQSEVKMNGKSGVSLSGGAGQENHAVRGRIPLNFLRICVDRCGEDLSGRVYCRMSREGLPFRNLGELLLRADLLFDEKDYPQSFQEKRSFAEQPLRYSRRGMPKAFLTDQEILNRQGAYCTLDVLVYSRRQASWQGILIRRGMPGKSFRSEKELMEIIIEETEEA